MVRHLNKQTEYRFPCALRREQRVVFVLAVFWWVFPFFSAFAVESTCVPALQKIVKRVPAGTFSKQAIIEIFKALNRAGVKVNYVNVTSESAETLAVFEAVLGIRVKGASVYTAAKRAFKDWDVARKAAGLDPLKEDINFDRAVILKILKSLNEAGIRVNQTTLANGSDEITEVIKRHLGVAKTGQQLLDRIHRAFAGGFPEARTLAEVPNQNQVNRIFGPFTEANIIKVFGLLHEAGIPVNKSALKPGSEAISDIIELVTGERKTGSQLHSAASKRFGTFRHAQLAANLDPVKESGRRLISQNTHFWTDEVLVKAVKSLFSKRRLDTISMRRDMSPESAELIHGAIGVTKTGSALYAQVVKKHGSWYGFLEKKVGLNPRDFRPTRKFWTKDKIRNALYWLHLHDFPLNYDGIDLNQSVEFKRIMRMATGKEKTGHGLMAAIKNEYGGDFRKALADAGIEDPESVYQDRVWREEDIVRALNHLSANGVRINFGVMRRTPEADALVREVMGDKHGSKTNGTTLLHAAIHHFGSLDNALTAAGLNPMTERAKVYTYYQFAERIRKRSLVKHRSSELAAYHNRLFKIVDGMTEYKRRMGYLILDTLATEPALHGNLRGIADRISAEFNRSVPPQTIRNFLLRISKNPGFEGLAP